MSFFSVLDFMSARSNDIPSAYQHDDYMCETALEEVEGAIEAFICRPLQSLDTVALSKVRPIAYALALRWLSGEGNPGLSEVEEIALEPYKAAGIVSLDLFKAHIAADELIDVGARGDLASNTDALLSHYLAAAEEHVIDMLGKPLADFSPVPVKIKQAILQIAGHFYANREAVVVGSSGNELPYGVADLIRPYRVEVTGHVRP